MSLPSLSIDPPVSIPAATLPAHVRRRRLVELYAAPAVSLRDLTDLLLVDMQLRMSNNEPSTLPSIDAQWFRALLASNALGADGFAVWIESDHAYDASDTVFAFQMVGAHLAAHLVEQSIQSLPESLYCREARLALSTVNTCWVQGEHEQSLFVLDGMYLT